MLCQCVVRFSLCNCHICMLKKLEKTKLANFVQGFVRRPVRVIRFAVADASSEFPVMTFRLMSVMRYRLFDANILSVP